LLFNVDYFYYCDCTGRVYAIGGNAFGQLGIGPNPVMPSGNEDKEITFRHTLTPVMGPLVRRTCVDVSAGSEVSFAVTQDGLLSMFQMNGLRIS
jgi:alpha-tubulin suppressor-like RCC1 family protein